MPLPLRDHHAFLPTPPSPSLFSLFSLSLLLSDDHGWREATFRQIEGFDTRSELSHCNKTKLGVIETKEYFGLRVHCGSYFH